MRATPTQWTGRILSVVLIVFLWFDSALKLFKAAVALDSSVALALPESLIFPLGILLLFSTLMYAIPRTSVIGAILLTGYLGGAVATHLRISDPTFSRTLFPVYLGIAVWVALVLRSPRLRSVMLR